MRRIPSLALVLLLAACNRSDVQPGLTDINGVMPDLSFQLMRANDGAAVTPDDYRGKVVALYFGYTHCPDECPTTLSSRFHLVGLTSERGRQGDEDIGDRG